MESGEEGDGDGGGEEIMGRKGGQVKEMMIQGSRER